jgi:hypothetical protein
MLIEKVDPIRTVGNANEWSRRGREHRNREEFAAPYVKE